MLFSWIMILAVLWVAADQDRLTMMLPIELFGLLALAVTLYEHVVAIIDWKDSLIGFICGVVMFLILAVFFKGGGGDIIMMGVLGWCLGIKDFLAVCLCAALTMAIYPFVRTVIRARGKTRSEKKTMRKAFTSQMQPFAPYVFGAAIFVAAVSVLVAVVQSNTVAQMFDVLLW